MKSKLNIKNEKQKWTKKKERRINIKKWQKASVKKELKKEQLK